MTSSRARPVALASALALLLGGCAGGGHEVKEPAPDKAAYPVVEVGQARSVLDAVDGALVRGVTASDTPTTVDARLLGPFLELELAEARTAAKRKTKVTKPAEVERLRLIVPTSQAWPRFFIEVGNSDKTSLPVLRVLRSSSPRVPYGLWAEATMLPSATLPETAQPAVGSPMIATDASGFVASPEEALKGFAGYLNGGAKTTPSSQYRRSIYSDQLMARLAGDRKELKAHSLATVSSTHVVGSSEPLAIRTADGSALVIGELRQTYLVKVKKGKGSVKISDRNLAALAGKDKFSTSFTQTAVEVVVLNVPPEGRGLITVIAAQKGAVKAVAK
jgi:hypothetical protein